MRRTSRRGDVGLIEPLLARCTMGSGFATAIQQEGASECPRATRLETLARVLDAGVERGERGEREERGRET